MNNTILMTLPADFFGKSIDEAVVRDVVANALFESGPVVVLNHVWGAFNNFKGAIERREAGNNEDYKAAVELAGLVMRYACENRPR